MPVFRLDSDTAAGRGAHARDPGALRRGSKRGPGRHPDGRQGPRFPRGHAERDPRRRCDPALPRLPRRGAHLRDGRPAGRAQRARRGRGRGDRPDAGPRCAQHRPRRRATTPPGFLAGELERRRGAALPAVLPSGADRTRRRERGAARRGAASGSAAELRDALPARTELLGPAPMFRVRNRHRRRFLVKASDRERDGRGDPDRWSSASAPTARSARSRSASTSTLSEVPAPSP